ncbi:hypothetical protein KQX54_002436 [Cotesia glomerata]|uniref:Uncharacterized protein n=1 Tax=Cotesia glomerata TaxID=32391 RepID=A0AAV7J476_COTGL|nr:hypothetical protein KQX54_002436 [Cotesia glomerata]
MKFLNCSQCLNGIEEARSTVMSKPPCDPLLITKRPGPNGGNSHRRISIPVEFHRGSSARVPRLPKMLRVAFNAASLRGGTRKPPADNTRFGYYCYGEGGCQQGKSLGSSFARKRNKRKLFAKKSLKISQSPAGSCAHEFFMAGEDKASLHSHSQRQNNVNKELDGRISACKREDNVFEKCEVLKFLWSSPQCYTPDDSWNLYTSGSTSSSYGSGSTTSSCRLETAGNTSANTKLNSLDFQRLNTVLPDEFSWKFLSKKKFEVTEREISRRCFLNGLDLVVPRKIDEKPMMSIFELELESNSGGEGVKSCLNRRSESGYLRKREPKSVRFLIDEEANKNNSKNEDIENSCLKNVLEVDGSLNENISNKVEHENFKLFTPASITVGPFKRLSRAFISTSASGFGDGDGDGDDVDVETKANISDLRIINPTLELEMTSTRETKETKMRNLKVDINGVSSFHSGISQEADNTGDLTSMPRDNALGQSLNSNLNRIPSADRDKYESNRGWVFADGINPTDRLTTAATASGGWERGSGASGVRSPNAGKNFATPEAKLPTLGAPKGRRKSVCSPTSVKWELNIVCVAPSGRKLVSEVPTPYITKHRAPEYNIADTQQNIAEHNKPCGCLFCQCRCACNQAVVRKAGREKGGDMGAAHCPNHGTHGSQYYRDTCNSMTRSSVGFIICWSL